MGACNNPSDLMKLMDQNLDKMTAQQCGMMCIAQPAGMQSACAKMCFQAKIMVSDPCGTCWGDVVACGIQMCLTECLMGQMQCDTCTAAKCQPAFKTCSGLP